MYGRQEYMNPVLGAPYGEVDRIDFYQSQWQPTPCNPMDEVYRIALRSLADSFEREMTAINRFYPMEYDQRHYYYDLESEARYRFEKAKNRLYDEFRNAAQQYVYRMTNQGYGYGLRQNRLPQYSGWDWGSSQDYTYKFTYLYSKETTPVMPTETKKFIIISSAGAAEHPTEHKTLAEAEAEATRLAKQFPKQEFTVYVTQKSFKVADKPVDVKVYA